VTLLKSMEIGGGFDDAR